jgi:dTDP-4-dehydrorhamnose 3,5-epimerase
MVTELPALPQDMVVHELRMHSDERGVLTELFRNEWNLGVQPVQWNAVTSEPNVLRGVHVHVLHWDYLIVPSGCMLLAVKDLRTDSRTFGLSAQIELSDKNMRGVVVPPGVAHGFYFPVPTLHIYCVSEYWSVDDELGCHWADPALGFTWPTDKVVLSERDEHLPTLEELISELSSRRRAIASIC